MNILIFSWRGLGHPHEGGAEIVTHEHARAWVKAGHSVTLFTSKYKDAKSVEKIDGVKIVRAGRQILTVQIRALFWYLFKQNEIYDLVIDQIHGIGFFTPFFVRVKKLGFIHEVATDVWEDNPLPKPMYYFPAVLGKLFEPIMFKLFYRNMEFMTVSNSTKSDLVRFGLKRENIKVILNGVRIKNKKRILKKQKTIIYLGALAKDKGIEDALKVFSNLNKLKMGFDFWIVGASSNNYLQFLKQKAKEFALGKRIVFWGFVSEDKKNELLMRAKILLNPSKREGWGLVNIEANKLGTPVVGYKVPGMVDSVVDGKTGFLVSYGRIDELVEQIVKLVKNEKKYISISNKAKLWADKFDWELATKESLKLIESIK